MTFVLRLLVNMAALLVATRIVPGVTFTGGWLALLGVAVTFGAVNTFVRPVTWVLTLPFIFLTLGLFLLVVNGMMLWITSVVSSTLGLGFHVSGFWAALWGALTVSIVSMMLSVVVRDRPEPRRWNDER